MTNALTLDEIQTMPLADRWNISVKKIHDAAVAENISVSDAWQRLFG
jgi:aryl carrier-like protein